MIWIDTEEELFINKLFINEHIWDCIYGLYKLHIHKIFSMKISLIKGKSNLSRSYPSQTETFKYMLESSQKSQKAVPIFYFKFELIGWTLKLKKVKGTLLTDKISWAYFDGQIWNVLSMFQSEPKLPDGFKKVYAPWDFFMVKVPRFLWREYVAIL